MNLLTISDLPKETRAEAQEQTVIRLEDVSVNYRVPRERVASLKEHAIRWIQRRLQYDNFLALQAVNLEVRRGDVVGIIGRNGAGKSTLLKVIARVLRPTRGRVVVHGRVAPLLEFGAGFHPELTGRENVFLNGALLGFSRGEMQAKFNRIVDFAELWNFIDAPLRTYSSGMIARLGFAIATDVDPDVLIVDEILGVGDTEFQQKSAERINDFHKAGVTFLLVSHSLDVVRNLCNKAVWLDNGQVVASGPADQVIESYLADVSSNEQARMAEEQLQASQRGESSAEAAILDVCFLDAAGVECQSFASGQKMIARIKYTASRRIEKPVFGVAIFRSDGVHVNGPNTRFSDYPIDWIEGQGEIDYVVESLPLLEGTYEFSASIYDFNCIRPFDVKHRHYKFLVRRGGIKESYGLVYFPAHWEHHRLPESSGRLGLE